MREVVAWQVWLRCVNYGVKDVNGDCPLSSWRHVVSVDDARGRSQVETFFLGRNGVVLGSFCPEMKASLVTRTVASFVEGPFTELSILK